MFPRPRAHFFATASLAVLLLSIAPLFGFDLPTLNPIPPIPAQQPLGSVTMGNPANFAEVKLDFPIESDLTTWTAIASLAAGGTPWSGNVIETGTGGQRAVTVTDTVAFSANPRRFLRLRATR